jgi:hypothetical protein
VRKPVSSVRPRPPATGESQNGCYLGHTHDCAGGISREHYVSKDAPEELSEGVVAIDGFFWQPPGEKKIEATPPPIGLIAARTCSEMCSLVRPA